MGTSIKSDDESAIALREAGLPVSEAMDEKEAFRAYMLPAQAAMRKQQLAAEKELKGFYTDWIFDKLNLVKHR